jgi:hypothetical protein
MMTTHSTTKTLTMQQKAKISTQSSKKKGELERNLPSLHLKTW